MRIRVILTLVALLVILFGFWRPLSENATIQSPDAISDTSADATSNTTSDANSDATSISKSSQPANLTVESTGGCEEAPPTRLEAGSQAYVALPTEGSGVRRNLRVRTEPGGEEIAVLQPGTDFTLIAEAVCADDELRWWLIRTLDGTITGWSVEGFAPDDYMITPNEG